MRSCSRNALSLLFAHRAAQQPTPAAGEVQQRRNARLAVVLVFQVRPLTAPTKRYSLGATTSVARPGFSSTERAAASR